MQTLGAADRGLQPIPHEWPKMQPKHFREE
jgi:hypothetical protein